MRTLIVRVRRKWRDRYERLNDRLGRPGQTPEQNHETAIQLAEIRAFNLDLDELHERKGINGYGVAT